MRNCSKSNCWVKFAQSSVHVIQKSTTLIEIHRVTNFVHWKNSWNCSNGCKYYLEDGHDNCCFLRYVILSRKQKTNGLINPSIHKRGLWGRFQHAKKKQRTLIGSLLQYQKSTKDPIYGDMFSPQLGTQNQPHSPVNSHNKAAWGRLHCIQINQLRQQQVINKGCLVFAKTSAEPYWPGRGGAWPVPTP